MSIITHSPRRPRFARATLGLCAALATAALPGAFIPAAYAANPVLLGQSNNETAQTLIANQSSNGIGFLAYGAGAGIGVYGQGGATGNGVQGYAQSGTASGVFGWNQAGGSGVFGHSEGGGDGVTGTALSSGGAVGVHGTGDRGVVGDGATGVVGNGTSKGATFTGGTFGADAVSQSSSSVGYGLFAEGPTGLKAFAYNNGNAIDVNGKAAFSRSGKVNIAAGQKSATVTGFPLGSTSLVLATAQNLLTTVSVQAAVPVSANSFTINLTAAVPAATTLTVAWFIVN